MTNGGSLFRAAQHLDSLLNLERQIWLLGAGVSFQSGIPLMWPLTLRVMAILAKPDGIFHNEDTKPAAELLQIVCSQMPDNCHIEHHLSQIGDLISLADRKTQKSIVYGGKEFSTGELRNAHQQIQFAIRHTVEFGYVPASNAAAEQIGDSVKSVVTHQFHEQFVHALFHERRAGLERRLPIRFFTTNYDTLLEDALAQHCIPFVDGFAGGATAFWDPRDVDLRLETFSRNNRHSAAIFKLHGSIDWILTETDIVMRVRNSSVQPFANPKIRLLIYPQATKYQVTQRDPFATLFADFRKALTTNAPTVLAVCGYSFGDDHINEEIERALRQSKNTVTLLACCQQFTNKDGSLLPNEGLPPILVRWLQSNETWVERIVILGSHGYYQGSLTNGVSQADLRPLDWWTFEGLTRFLIDGPEVFA